MKELLIVYMLKPQEEGEKFDSWPLHLTLLPWFEATDEDEAVEMLGDYSSWAPIEASFGGRDHFGQRGLQVRLVENTSKLQMLHDSLLKSVEKRGWSIRGRYTGASFRPHITERSEEVIGERVRIDRLYLVEALGQGYRRIISKVDLGG